MGSGVARAAEAGEDLAPDREVPVAERRCASPTGASPTSRHAAPCTRVRRTPRSTRGTGSSRIPGSASKSDAVHSHTSPTSAARRRRSPRRGSPTGRGCPRCGVRRGGPEVRARGSAPRRGVLHSASVGSRPPDHRAKASASYQHTCCTGSSGGTASTRPNRRRTHRRRRRVPRTRALPSPASWRHAHPAGVHRRGVVVAARATNSPYARLVTGVVSMRYGASVDLVRGALVVVGPRRRRSCP